jgi:hypothetical protein
MRRSFLICLMLVARGVVADGQSTARSTDHLGAHLNNGRGCTACHIPHRGAEVNGTAKAPGSSARTAILWGEDVTSQYEETIESAGIKPAELVRAESPEVSGLLTCLSCHDGNFAPRPAIKERVYERLPANYEVSNSVPTLILMKPAIHGDGNGVICTTCHDPHRMNAVKAAGDSGSSLHYSRYATRFFFRAPCDPE